MTIPSETPDMTTKRICNTCQGTGIVKGLHNWDSGGTREEKCRNCHEAPKPSPTPQADSQPECYGDCPTDPKTCANPCKFEGRAARAPADSVLEDAAEPDMFWDYDDPECFGYDIEDVISEYAPGDIVKIDCAKRLPTIRVRVVADGDDLTYEIIGAPQADSQPAHQRDTAHLDEEIKLLADALDAAQADSVLEDAARLLESQHTWLTNVAAANLVRSLAARKQGGET